MNALIKQIMQKSSVWNHCLLTCSWSINTFFTQTGRVEVEKLTMEVLGQLRGAETQSGEAMGRRDQRMKNHIRITLMVRKQPFYVSLPLHLTLQRVQGHDSSQGTNQLFCIWWGAEWPPCYWDDPVITHQLSKAGNSYETLGFKVVS